MAELAQTARILSPDNRAWRYDFGLKRLVPVTWLEFDLLLTARPVRQNRLRTVVRNLPILGALAHRLMTLREMMRHRSEDTPVFESGDRFIFGDWVTDGARLEVYTKMIAEGVRIIFYCHDLIPILYPDVVQSETRQWFVPYMSVLLRPDTLLLCNSRSTLADLTKVATVPEEVRVIPPGSDIVGAAAGHVRRVDPDREYLLYVSTLQPRKNHRLLLDAYETLMAAGRRDLPLLVFVGRRGWVVDDLWDDVERGTGAASHVRILEHVSDDELRDLYANALFTVFPSFYEGWGMPVSESLAMGRFCLSSDRGALPEAGAGLTELLDPEDSGLWADRIAYYCDNRDALRDRERAIGRSYRPWSWSDFRREAMAALADQ